MTLRQAPITSNQKEIRLNKIDDIVQELAKVLLNTSKEESTLIPTIKNKIECKRAFSIWERWVTVD